MKKLIAITSVVILCFSGSALAGDRDRHYSRDFRGHHDKHDFDRRHYDRRGHYGKREFDRRFIINQRHYRLPHRSYRHDRRGLRGHDSHRFDRYGRHHRGHPPHRIIIHKHYHGSDDVYRWLGGLYLTNEILHHDRH